MAGRSNALIYLMLAVLLCCASTMSSAQEDRRLSGAAKAVSAGDSLRFIYRFEESLAAYDKALELTDGPEYTSSDSLFRRDVEDRILMSENGKSMKAFVDVPDVVARRRFFIGDFFLYYPLRDRSWRPIPNRLDSARVHRFARATYVRDGDRTVYWTAEDGEGIRNIYSSSLRDSIWTLPSLLNEQMMSASDEIYPMISPDGKSLYFASEGLHGVGGYDIYVSRWDEDSGDWGAPVNMGFPYSSPADDFLFIDTEDGRYSMFASNRDCSSDSVWVYVLEFDNVPVRREVDDPDELLKISALDPVCLDETTAVDAISEDADIRRYMLKMVEINSLKDSLALYSAAAAEGRPVPRLQYIRDSLDVVMGQLQQIEMDLLMKGIVPDPEKLMEATEKAVAHEEPEYRFSRMNMGGPLNMTIEEPEVRFDYSFKVLPQAQFAEDQSMPGGIVYQIQIFASKRKASMKSLKGLSPVYEVPGANGHIVYRVGLFRTYSDVLSNLNTVKKLGFRSAFIVAFIDGKSVTVAKAREKEKMKPKTQQFYEVRVVAVGGELDSGVAAGIRQQASGKDIAKIAREDGSAIFVVGPFTDRAKAEELAMFVRAMGIRDVSCEIRK